MNCIYSVSSKAFPYIVIEYFKDDIVKRPSDLDLRMESKKDIHYQDDELNAFKLKGSIQLLAKDK